MNSYTGFLVDSDRKVLQAILSGILFIFSQNVFSYLPCCTGCGESSVSTEDNSTSGSQTPGVQTSQPVASSFSTSLDTSLELANILRSEDVDQNLVFSPRAMTSLRTLLEVSAHLTGASSLASQARISGIPDNVLALNHSGPSGYRDQSWFLARNAVSFAAPFYDPQFNTDSQNSRFDPRGLAEPDRISQEIGEFVFQGSPDSDSSANSSPLLRFSDDAALVAITVATFSQRWRDRFASGTMTFTTRSEETIQVPSIQSVGSIIVHYGQDESGWQVIILPYAHKGDRMILFVPPEQAVPATIADLTPERVRRLVRSAEAVPIRLTMPSFLTQGSHEFHSVLQGSSLQWMISPASFSQNLITPPIYMLAIESRQIIAFESDETGSRATVVTQTGVVDAYMRERKTVIINRPFTALVVNSEGQVCFHIEINKPR